MPKNVQLFLGFISPYLSTNGVLRYGQNQMRSFWYLHFRSMWKHIWDALCSDRISLILYPKTSVCNRITHSRLEEKEKSYFKCPSLIQNCLAASKLTSQDWMQWMCWGSGYHFIIPVQTMLWETKHTTTLVKQCSHRKWIAAVFAIENNTTLRHKNIFIAIFLSFSWPPKEGCHWVSDTHFEYENHFVVCWEVRLLWLNLMDLVEWLCNGDFLRLLLFSGIPSGQAGQAILD